MPGPGTAALVRHDERAETGGERPSRGAGRRHGDRVLCFTDGLVEEREAGGEQFGEERLIDWVNRVERSQDGVRAVVRALSHVLKEKRGGRTSDDATPFLIEWR